VAKAEHLFDNRSHWKQLFQYKLESNSTSHRTFLSHVPTTLPRARSLSLAGSTYEEARAKHHQQKEEYWDQHD